MLADGMMRALRESGYEVATAADGNRILEALRAQGIATPVLIVTAPAQRELEAQVCMVVPAGDDVHSSTLLLGPLEVDRERRVARYAGTYIDISPRECELLAVLLASPGQAVSRDRIIAAMNDRGHYAAENAIEVCVHRLRRKLESGAVRIATVRGLGYYIALEAQAAEQAIDTPV